MLCECKKGGLLDGAAVLGIREGGCKESSLGWCWEEGAEVFRVHSVEAEGLGDIPMVICRDVCYLDLQFRKEELGGGKIVGTVTLKMLPDLSTVEKNTQGYGGKSASGL